MTTAQLLIRRNSGAWQTGGVTGAVGDVITLGYTPTTGVRAEASVYELYGVPPDYPLPSGWTNAGNGVWTYPINGASPTFTIDRWGKYMPALRFNGANDEDAGLVDFSSAISVPDVDGKEDIGRFETDQFHDDWTEGFRRSMRVMASGAEIGSLPVRYVIIGGNAGVERRRLTPADVDMSASVAASRVWRQKSDGSAPEGDYLAASLVKYGVTALTSATHNSAALAQALADLRSQGGGVLVLPPFDFSINSTLHIGVPDETATTWTCGIEIRGESATITRSAGEGRSRIIWAGDVGGTMCIIGNTRRCKLKGVTFDGAGTASCCVQVLHDQRSTDGVTTPPVYHLTCDENTFERCSFTRATATFTQVGIYSIANSAGDCSRTRFVDCVWYSRAGDTVPSLGGHTHNSTNAFECELVSPRFEWGFVPNGDGQPTQQTCNYSVLLLAGNLRITNFWSEGTAYADIYVAPYNGGPITRLIVEGGEVQFNAGPFLKVIKHKDPYLPGTHNGNRLIAITGVTVSSGTSPVSVDIDFGNTGADTLYASYQHCPITLTSCTLEGALKVRTPGASITLNDVRFDGPDYALPLNRAESTRPKGPVINASDIPDISLVKGVWYWGGSRMTSDPSEQVRNNLRASEELFLPGTGLVLKPHEFTQGSVPTSVDWFGCATDGVFRMLVSLSNTTENVAISRDGGATWERQTLPGTLTGCDMVPGLWVVCSTNPFTDPIEATTKYFAVSRDEGRTWRYYTHSLTGIVDCAIERNVATPRVLFVRSGNTGGVNWAIWNSGTGAVTQGTTGKNYNRRAIHIGGYWYVTQYDVGTAMQVASAGAMSFADGSLTADGQTEIAHYRGVTLAYVQAASNNLFVSTDSCATWQTYTIAQQNIRCLSGGFGGWFGCIQDDVDNILTAPTGGIISAV